MKEESREMVNFGLKYRDNFGSKRDGWLQIEPNVISLPLCGSLGRPLSLYTEVYKYTEYLTALSLPRSLNSR